MRNHPLRNLVLITLRAAALIAGLAVGAAAAEESDLITLETRDDSQGWEAVGRLDIRGQGFCTAALIREALILTAAHCLFDAQGAPISPDRFTFRAGLRNGQAAVVRGVTRALAHPGFAHMSLSPALDAVGTDIAVLRLNRPIRASRIQPYQIAARPITGDAVSVVSYGRNRADAPSLQETCHVLARQSDMLVLTCMVEQGASGAPVFMRAGGEAKIVSVVSSSAKVDGDQVALGSLLDTSLNTLLNHFAALPADGLGGTHRLIGPTDRSGSGAKFIRP